MSVIQASTTRSVTAPAFNAHATAIFQAYRDLDRASAKFSAAVSRTMNQYVDACRVAPDMAKDEASCKALQKAIREAEPFVKMVADCRIEKKTITEYAQGAARAFFYGVEWTPTLKNDPAMALPWSKQSKGDSAAKAGKVTSTSRQDLDATISKALQQARTLGLTGFAADMLDLAIEALDGFKEPTAQ